MKDNNEKDQLKSEIVEQALLENVSGGMRKEHDLCKANNCTGPGGGNICTIDVCSFKSPL